MRHSLIRSAVAIVALFGAACGFHRKANDVAPIDHTIITRDQLLDNKFLTVYDAVEALHANWLSARGTDSFQNPSEVRVYLDNTSLGGVQTLRNIASNTVAYVQHFDGVSATARWGIDHVAGVIYVSSHPRTSDPDEQGIARDHSGSK